MTTLNEKFIIQCKSCKQPILKENKLNKRDGQFTCCSVQTGRVVVMPNVSCPICKAKHTYTASDKNVTEYLSKKEKKELNKKIQDDIFK